MNGKRRCLLLVKRTQAGKILRTGLLQLHVVAHQANNVRLLLDRVCQIARVRHQQLLSVKSSGATNCLCQVTTVEIASAVENRVGFDYGFASWLAKGERLKAKYQRRALNADS